VDDAAQSLMRVTNDDFDFRHGVVLEEAPPDWVEPTDVPTRAAAVHITHYEPNRVEMMVETAVNGLLVLTDTYAPGWTVLVNGRDTPLYIANHAFRALVVPSGIHRVEFVYKPAAFRVGAAVSLLTMAILIPAALLFRAKEARISSQ
jgi:uncharacterized membrane protein YfhO